MPKPAHVWTVSCLACDIVVGTVEDGHFFHDPGCGRPLAIGAGRLRCCRCGGHLSGQAHPVAEAPDEPDDAEARAPVSILRFARPAALGDDLRQRL